MITLLRCFVARRALRWLPAVEAALSAILFALLLPSDTPVLPATICLVAAWLLQRALGGFTNAPFQPALAASALAFATISSPCWTSARSSAVRSSASFNAAAASRAFRSAALFASIDPLPAIMAA